MAEIVEEPGLPVPGDVQLPGDDDIQEDPQPLRHDETHLDASGGDRQNQSVTPPPVSPEFLREQLARVEPVVEHVDPAPQAGLLHDLGHPPRPPPSLRYPIIRVQTG